MSIKRTVLLPIRSPPSSYLEWHVIQLHFITKLTPATLGFSLRVRNRECTHHSTCRGDARRGQRCSRRARVNGPIACSMHFGSTAQLWLAQRFLGVSQLSCGALTRSGLAPHRLRCSHAAQFWTRPVCPPWVCSSHVRYMLPACLATAGATVGRSAYASLSGEPVPSLGAGGP